MDTKCLLYLAVEFMKNIVQADKNATFIKTNYSHEIAFWHFDKELNGNISQLNAIMLNITTTYYVALRPHELPVPGNKD